MGFNSGFKGLNIIYSFYK